MKEVSRYHEIHHMRCSVHCIRVAMRDALRSETIPRLLKKIRQDVAVARMSKVDRIIRKRGRKSTVLDQAKSRASAFNLTEASAFLK